jgi:hypothetical protein
VTSASLDENGGRNGAALSPCPLAALMLPENGSVRHPPALTFDPAEYLSFLEDSDWTDSQKREFIEALWVIVIGFVDLGFDLNPVGKVVDIKGLELDSPSVVSSEPISNNTDTTEAKLAGELAAREMDS